MLIQTQETQIILIIKTIRTFKKLSYWKVIKTYNIPKTILCNRIASRIPYNNTWSVVQNLTKLKE